MAVRVFGKFFRGFSSISLNLDGTNFVLGDNSSGKSSLLHFIDAVLRDDLGSVPSLREEFGVSAYDYFSPIFPNEDVIFGFTKSENDSSYSKMITVSKEAGKPPRVIKCSYFLNNVFISIRFSNGVFSKKIANLSEPVADMLRMHGSDNGYETLEAPVVESTPIESMAALFIIFGPEELANISTGTKGVVSNLLSSGHLPSSSFVGPIRSLPEKYYDQTRRVSPLGLHFASMWASIPKKDATSYFGKIARFGKESGLFENVWVEPISKSVEESPLLVHVKRNGHDFLLNQVGVGVSQIAPVLTEAIFAVARRGRRVALFQQPELHLHPVAQAALGSFFAKLTSDGITAFLETHSNYLIDRFRSDHRSTKKRNGSVARMLFCESRSDGNHVTECKINELGEIQGAPDAYYDFFINESLRTMM